LLVEFSPSQLHSNNNPVSNDYTNDVEKQRYAGLTVSDKVVNELFKELLKFEDINILKLVELIPVPNL